MSLVPPQVRRETTCIASRAVGLLMATDTACRSHPWQLCPGPPVHEGPGAQFVVAQVLLERSEGIRTDLAVTFGRTLRV
jgi:hypothetical protein